MVESEDAALSGSKGASHFLHHGFWGLVVSQKCKFGISICVLLCALTCVSCLTASVPKSAKMDSPSSSNASNSSSVDKGLTDKWELMFQVNDKGEEQKPREATRTILEFTGSGEVVFNRMDKDSADMSKSRSGKYTVDRDQIVITDDAGNTVKWPYQVTGDNLMISMPEVSKKFHWRRFRLN